MKASIRLTIKDFCQIGIFTALIAITAQFAIPMPSGVPITLQTFMIPLAAIILGTRKGTWAALIYIFLGIIGIPVFAGFRGGLQMVTGVTGGYILTFPILALAAGYGMDRAISSRSRTGKTLWLAGGLLAGAFFNYLGGMLMYGFLTGTDLLAAYLVCVLPYIPTAVIKIALLLIVGPKAWKLLKKSGFI